MIDKPPENKSRGIVWFPPKPRPAPEVETPGPGGTRNERATDAQQNDDARSSHDKDLRRRRATGTPPLRVEAETK